MVTDIGMEVMEGKKPMTLYVYTYLTRLLFKSDKKEHILDHLFLVLDW